MSGIKVGNLTFIGGKGGVGKTLLSESLAHLLSQGDKKVLWITIEDPTRPKGEMRPISKNLAQFNCDAEKAFEEYIELKLPFGGLSKLLVQNKWIRTLAKASPGIHEVVILGKIWYETRNYHHVVVDLPASGHGMALFQSTANYGSLFKGSPVQKDAENVLKHLNNPEFCSHWVVTLPEEMPIQESIEFSAHIGKIFPDNTPKLIVNRKFPDLTSLANDISPNSDDWESPLANNGADFLIKRSLVEAQHLLGLKKERHDIPFVDPTLSRLEMIKQISNKLNEFVR